MLRRLHELAADRVRWIQYPKPRAYPVRQRKRGLPWEYRVTLGIVGLVLLGFSSIGAVVLFVFLRAAVLYG